LPPFRSLARAEVRDEDGDSCLCVDQPSDQAQTIEQQLERLTELVKPWHEHEAEWGFNKWIKAQTGQPSGRDWQTWSAAMYLYAAECVHQ
jgi:regulator of RNase E activity RraB